jgi:hypothetical protein
VHTPTEDKIDDTKDKFKEELEFLLGQLPKYHMKILLQDSNAKVGRKYIFKSTIGNDSLPDNYNGVRLIKFATSKNLIVKTTLIPDHKTLKYTWTSTDWNMHNQIGHILIDKRQH